MPREMASTIPATNPSQWNADSQLSTSGYRATGHIVCHRQGLRRNLTGGATSP